MKPNLEPNMVPLKDVLHHCDIRISIELLAKVKYPECSRPITNTLLAASTMITGQECKSHIDCSALDYLTEEAAGAIKAILGSRVAAYNMDNDGVIQADEEWENLMDKEGNKEKSKRSAAEIKPLQP